MAAAAVALLVPAAALGQAVRPTSAERTPDPRSGSPRAPALLAELLEALGYDVSTEESDWIIGADDAAIAWCTIDPELCQPQYTNDPQQRPYDDTGWTFPEAFGVQAVRVVDTTAPVVTLLGDAGHAADS